MSLRLNLGLAASVLVCAPLAAQTVNVDLSGATTGAIVNGVGASFAQSFAGQTVSGINLSGAPTGPLTLSASGSITVAFWDSSNSLLSQPGNAAPLVMLLNGNANAISFRSGSASGGSITLTGYANNGAVTGSTVLSLLSGYNDYSFSGLGVFRGLAITGNDDPAGLRFQNFSYQLAGGAVVPEPATWAMMIIGIGASGAALRRRRRAFADA